MNKYKIAFWTLMFLIYLMVFWLMPLAPNENGLSYIEMVLLFHGSILGSGGFMVLMTHLADKAGY